MATEFSMVDEIVFPSRNNVGGGRRWTELQITDWLAGALVNRYVVSGFTLPATDPDLNIDMSDGVAYFEGYLTTAPNATTITVPDDSTSFVFLKLNRDGSSLVDETKLVVDNTPVPIDDDHLLLAEIISAAGVITSTKDLVQRSNINEVGDTAYAAL